VARTRKDLRQLTVEQLEVPQITGTSSDTSGSASTLADGSLGRFGDNDLVGAWLYISSGAPTYRDVRITDSAQTSDSGKGIITFRPAQNASSMTANEDYEILPYESSAIHQAIDEALMELYDSTTLVRNIWLDHWLTGSPIYNSTFEHGTDGWTVDNTTISTINYTNDHIVPGQFAARLAGAGTLLLDAKYSQFLQDLSGDTVTLRAWMRTSTGGQARAQLLVDGRGDSNVVASTEYHSGDGQWELVSADGYAIPDTATQITVRIQAGSAETDCGAVWVEGGTRIREYPFPIGLAPNGPDSVKAFRVNIDEGSNTSDINPRRMRNMRYVFNKYRYAADELAVLDLRDMPSGGSVLRMPTSVPLTLPTADTSNIEVTTIDSLLICKMAAAKLLIKNMLHSPSTFRQRAEVRAGILMQEVRELAEGRGSSVSNAVELSPVW
jgi:hypothetical protein